MQEVRRTGNDCAACERRPQLKQDWGCERDGKFLYDMGGVPTRRCPIALQRHADVIGALGLYAHYKRGHLPNGSGLRGETAFFRASMLVLDALSSEAESWYMKQPKKKR